MILRDGGIIRFTRVGMRKGRVGRTSHRQGRGGTGFEKGVNLS